MQDTTLTRIEDLDPERALAFIEDYRRFRRYGTLGAVFGVAAPFLYFTLFRGGTQFGGFGGMLFMVAGGLARRFAVRLALRGNHIAASLQPEVERRLVLRPQWTATTKTRIKPPITIDDQVRALCAPVIDDARPPSETA